MNDQQLRQDVLEELEYEPSIDADGIGVTVEHGVVSLTGHVPSYAQKLAAEQAAWRVKGVKAIAQEIQVRLPGDRQIHDDEIAKRALAILAWSAPFSHEAVQVKVTSGWVTLSGRLTWNYQREAAESSVRKLSGVVGVTNLITLEPTVQATNVRQRIVDALKRHAEVEAARITVQVHDDGTVHLDGEVDDWDERQAVERAVWSAPGVRAVEDRVRIV